MLAKDQWPWSPVCQCLFYSEFLKILIGRISDVIIVYVASILEKMVKKFWENAFVPCMYKFPFLPTPSPPFLFLLSPHALAFSR